MWLLLGTSSTEQLAWRGGSSNNSYECEGCIIFQESTEVLLVTRELEITKTQGIRPNVSSFLDPEGEIYIGHHLLLLNMTISLE